MSDEINQTNAVLLDQTTSGVKYTDQNLRTGDSPQFKNMVIRSEDSDAYPGVEIRNGALYTYDMVAEIRHNGDLEIGTITDQAISLKTNGTNRYRIEKDGNFDFSSNNILNARKVQFSDAGGDGTQFDLGERSATGRPAFFRDGSLEMQFNLESTAGGSNSIGFISASTSTGTNAVFDGSDILQKDSGSSRQFKSEIEPANITMDQIMQIEPKHFYHEQIDEYRHGLIAEQVRDAGLDEWVHENQDGEVESLSYGKFGATVALAGLHNHEERIKKLEKAVA